MGRSLRPIFNFHPNFTVMKKKNKRRKKDDDHISPYKSYSDGNIIKRICKWPGKVVSQHLKFSNVKRSWVILTPIWSTISLLIFGIQYSVTSILRVKHGKLFSGLIVTWLTFSMLVLINRPFTFEELSLLTTESWSFVKAIFTEEKADFNSFFSALIRPQSIGLFVISIVFFISANIQVIASWFEKWTHEDPNHSGSDLVYLILREYAPLSNRFMVIYFDTAVIFLIGAGFLYFNDYLAAIYLFTAATINFFYESGKTIENSTLPM